MILYAHTYMCIHTYTYWSGKRIGVPNRIRLILHFSKAGYVWALAGVGGSDLIGQGLVLLPSVIIVTFIKQHY